MRFPSTWLNAHISAVGELGKPLLMEEVPAHTQSLGFRAEGLRLEAGLFIVELGELLLMEEVPAHTESLWCRAAASRFESGLYNGELGEPLLMKEVLVML